ncbi:hypothetical protein [Flavobacterium sp. MDT1-60]|uniref:hypothetical protein n=1 Tax=Flavobacterium sp. MDT1-60 TaxID=1979344 RepID=UPI001785F1A7|nr:hypothetical protein [Flavobacterium sp. MDT1-60]QOG01066.1 hypothetical protein IHE43_14715 [Flavobacterium sp. MDT1-60]
MNPFNLLINYVIANSRASFYNVPGNQEITNTALLTGMVSENPLMSYLIIDNKAKIEGEKTIVPVVTQTPTGTGATQGLQAPGISATGAEDPKNTNETPKGTSTGETAPVNVVTLENVKTEISDSTKALKEEIAKISENNKVELQKIIAETFNPKIEGLEKSNTALNTAIIEIKGRLDEISKSTPAPAPDKIVPNKDVSIQKEITKNGPK